MLKFRYFILLLIVILGAFFRFYNLDKVPPSLNWDEVAFGYNAYSILTTGQDEYGKFMPLYFRSLDDYKRPVYSYLAAFSVKVFGLNDFSVRFPAAFFGTLTVVIVYFLTKELFSANWKFEIGNLKLEIISLLSAFFLAIVPWHVQFTRPALEASVGLFFTSFGVLCFLLGMRKNIWWLPLSAFSFGLSEYSYLGQRVTVPFLTLILGLIFWKQAFTFISKRQTKKIIPLLLFICITLVFWFLLYKDAQKPEGNIRYKATTIVGNSEEYQHAFEHMRQDGKLGINIPRRLFHDNPHVTTLGLITRGYLTHFSPDYFFFDLGQQHHHAPSVGILYVWMLPFILIGIGTLIKKNWNSSSLIIFAWLFFAPIGSAVTWQIPHALRASEMIVPMQIIISVGVGSLCMYLWQQKRFLFFPVFLCFALTVILSAFYFFHQYHVHLPLERSQEWVYGRKEMVEFVEERKDKYEKIIVSTSLEYPWIFFLYYSHYDPRKYLEQGGTIAGGWNAEDNRYDTYEFHKFNFDSDRKKGKFLFIGKPEDFPSGVKTIHKIYYLNEKEAIYIVES